MSHAPAHHHRSTPRRSKDPGSPGPCSGSPWPPRSWSSSTSPWSTPPSRPSDSSLHLDGSEPAVARHGVRDDVRRRPPPRRTHLRPAVTTRRLPDRPRPLHRRLPGQRVRRQRRAAHRRPCRPGPQRRAADPLSTLPDHHHLRRRRSARPHSPCGAWSAASASPPASSSAGPSPPGPAGSTSSGSTSPSVSSPWWSGSASSPRRA